MVLQESGEMYLETIYILAQKSPYVRSIDVAEYMGFSKPSVSRGMGLLKQGGYLTADENGYLALTELGDTLSGGERQRLGSHQVSTMRIANKVYSVDHGRMS